MDNYGASEEKVAQYNDAQLSIIRLNELWIECYQCMNAGKLNSWKFTLDKIRLEIYHDIARRKNAKVLIKEDDRLMMDIVRASKISRSALYHALQKRHENLKVLQDIAGKAGSYRYSDEEGL